jgi:L-threonylcarbamoyladenylate synthase
MKYRHYAPKAPVILIKSDEKSRQKYISEQNGRIAVLAYSEHLENYRRLPSAPDVYDLGAACDPETQAHRLFYLLREIDKIGYDCIYAPLPGVDGVALALYNRMIRAAAYTILEIKE